MLSHELIEMLKKPESWWSSALLDDYELWLPVLDELMALVAPDNPPKWLAQAYQQEKESKKIEAGLKRLEKLVADPLTPLDKSFFAFLMLERKDFEENMEVVFAYWEKKADSEKENPTSRMREAHARRMNGERWAPSWFCYDIVELSSYIENIDGALDLEIYRWVVKLLTTKKQCYKDIVENQPIRLKTNISWHRWPELSPFIEAYTLLTQLRASDEKKNQAFRQARCFWKRYKGKDVAILKRDAMRMGCQPLSENILNDAERGHWDLWPAAQKRPMAGPPYTVKTDAGWARDPRGDIQKDIPVCVDFGTSSTVVAVREDGRRKLLRIGSTDWSKLATGKDFENPTVLQFADAMALAGPWETEKNRPLFSSSALKSAHQARAELRSSSSSSVLSSSFPEIKTWASRGKPEEREDQKGHRFLLFNEEMDDGCPSFDPVEVYAFCLGLSINTQNIPDGRIYHDYHLSFPVNFNKEVRERIRSSFEKGLRRSLPASLVQQEGWEEETPFRVYEGADEPVAYAAAWLIQKMENDEGFRDRMSKPDFPGFFCGIFDFGGGTTDFAFLLCRPGTGEEQENQRWDIVLELLDSDGDPELGGEKLLHMLTSELVQDRTNAANFLSQNIPFLRPEKGRVAAGMEPLFHAGRAARINTLTLCEALRPLWEEGKESVDPDGRGAISCSLQSEDGREKLIDISIDTDHCMEILKRRIQKGVDAFFTAAFQTIKRHSLEPEILHIRLAGNSCRSPLVEECFHEAMRARGEQHFELEKVSITVPDDTLSLKNGVAGGLLELVHGEKVGVIRSSDLTIPGQAFRYVFGTFSHGRLKPMLSRYSVCGRWLPAHLKVREDLLDVFGYAQGPGALEGKLARRDSRELRCKWNESDLGKSISVRCSGPCSIEVSCHMEGEEPDTGHILRFDLSQEDKRR